MNRHLIGSLVIAALAVVAGPHQYTAEASFPGRNGKLAFASGSNVWVMRG